MSFDPAAHGWTKWESVGYAERTGPFWTRQDGAGWAFGVLIEDRHLNRGGIVHGGMLATLADIALGRTAWEHVRPLGCATIQLNMHYVAAAKLGQFVEARAELVRATSSLVFLRGQCRAGKRPIAMADGVWKILAEGRRLGSPNPDDAQ